MIKLKEIISRLFAFLKSFDNPLVEYCQAQLANPKSKIDKELQSYQLFFITL